MNREIKYITDNINKLSLQERYDICKIIHSIKHMYYRQTTGQMGLNTGGSASEVPINSAEQNTEAKDTTQGATALRSSARFPRIGALAATIASDSKGMTKTKVLLQA